MEAAIAIAIAIASKLYALPLLNERECVTMPSYWPREESKLTTQTNGQIDRGTGRPAGVQSWARSTTT